MLLKASMICDRSLAPVEWIEKAVMENVCLYDASKLVGTAVHVPVRTTFPETKIRSTILGLTIR